jgi:hypothetical protein
VRVRAREFAPFTGCSLPGQAVLANVVARPESLELPTLGFEDLGFSGPGLFHRFLLSTKPLKNLSRAFPLLDRVSRISFLVDYRAITGRTERAGTGGEGTHFQEVGGRTRMWGGQGSRLSLG